MGRGGGCVCFRWTCLVASAALLLPPLLFLTFIPQTRPYYYSSFPDIHHSTSNSSSTSTLKEEASHGNRSQALHISGMVGANSTFTSSSALVEEDGHLRNSISTIANSARDVAAAVQPKTEGKEVMGREERSFGDVGLKRIEGDLAKARRAIRRAVAAGRNRSSEVVRPQGAFIPRGVVYRNPLVFHQ